MLIAMNRGTAALAAFILTLLLSGAAFASGAECPDLTALQRLVGYVSWLGFVKGLGAVVFAIGLIYMGWGIIAKVVKELRVLLEVVGYVGSVALITSGYWLGAETLLWPVLVGCILFAATVFATVWIHKIETNDPKPIAALLMVVWGAVAIFYGLSEVGFLAMMALMTLLGFTIVVRQLSYGFGFEDDAAIPSGTMAALFILVAYVAVHVLVPSAPAAVLVFKPAAFWVSSFVAFIGLLIMSCRYYTEAMNAKFAIMQVVTITILLAALAAGMTFGINPLAGMAGTFLVFYLAAKPLDVPVHGRIAVGTMLTMAGAIMYGAWWYATQHITDVGQYLTLAQ